MYNQFNIFMQTCIKPKTYFYIFEMRSFFFNFLIFFENLIENGYFNTRLTSYSVSIQSRY
jgi:hypothetical protein